MRVETWAGLDRIWRPISADPLAIVGLALLSFILFLAIFGPSLAPYNPLQTSPAVFQPPGHAHWFGTDQFGRDTLSRVLLAFRLDLFIAMTAISAAMLIGMAAGGVAGYLGGRFDDVFMRVIDVVQAFPMLILAMALVAFLGVGLVNVILVTVIVNIAIFARLTRSEILSRKRLEFIDAARCSGASDARILIAFLIPNILGPVLVQATLSLGWAILNVAALSFLGIGINPPTPELGVMVAEGARFLSRGAWWLSVFPGLALVAAVFAFNLAGDILQDRLDPRRRSV
jgi:peptide/nickel transport system permease protein